MQAGWHTKIRNRQVACDTRYVILKDITNEDLDWDAPQSILDMAETRYQLGLAEGQSHCQTLELVHVIWILGEYDTPGSRYKICGEHSPQACMVKINAI